MTPRKPAPTGSGQRYVVLRLFRCTGCSTVRALSKRAPDDVALGHRPCLSCGTVGEQDLLFAKVDPKTQRVRFGLVPRIQGGMS